MYILFFVPSFIISLYVEYIFRRENTVQKD